MNVITVGGNIRSIEPGYGPRFTDTRNHIRNLIYLFKRDARNEEVLEHFPSITAEHVRVMREYYDTHREECLQKDREIDEYRAEQMRLQAIRFPPFEGTREQKLERWRKRILEMKMAGAMEQCQFHFARIVGDSACKP